MPHASLRRAGSAARRIRAAINRVKGDGAGRTALPCAAAQWGALMWPTKLAWLLYLPVCMSSEPRTRLPWYSGVYHDVLEQSLLAPVDGVGVGSM